MNVWECYLLKIFFNLTLKNLMCICVLFLSHTCRYPQRPGEGVGSPEAGFMGSCQTYDMHAENRLQVTWKSRWAISPALVRTVRKYKRHTDKDCWEDLAHIIMKMRSIMRGRWQAGKAESSVISLSPSPCLSEPRIQGATFVLMTTFKSTRGWGREIIQVLES